MKSTITTEATEKNSVKSVLVWKRFDKNSVPIIKDPNKRHTDPHILSILIWELFRTDDLIHIWQK